MCYIKKGNEYVDKKIIPLTKKIIVNYEKFGLSIIANESVYEKFTRLKNNYLHQHSFVLVDVYDSLDESDEGRFSKFKAIMEGNKYKILR